MDSFSRTVMASFPVEVDRFSAFEVAARLGIARRVFFEVEKKNHFCTQCLLKPSQ